jgi:hypothetical protein
VVEGIARIPALMNQKQRLLALPDGMRRGDFDDGAMLLITADDRVLKTRLESPV